MAWLYVPGLGGLNSGSSWPLDLTIELWATSSGIPMQRPCSWRGWKTKPWIQRLSGTISKPLMAVRGVEQWISSLRASRASQSALPAKGLPKVTNGGFGRRLSGLFARWNRASSSWRTCQGYLFEGWDTYSATWPSSGSMRNGECFLRPVAELPTSGGGSSSLLPTPSARDWRSGLASAETHARNARPLAEVISREVGGQLNPEWVEWLMGLPLGWTDCDVSVTELSPRWRQEHSMSLPAAGT